MKNTFKKQAAFSLVEVLIFTTVFALFFVLAATVVTTTLRITKENQNKIKATHYAEELKEWLQSEKEIDWGGTVFTGSFDTFTEIATQANPPPYTGAIPDTDFCFNASPIGDWPNRVAEGNPDNCYLMLENQFRRIATFSATVIDGEYVKQVSADISVSWKDGNMLRSIPLQVTFSIWE